MDRLRYIVGLLTLAVAVACGIFLFDLLADEDRSGLYSLRLEFKDVRGLKAGADVRYRGVHVGTVGGVGLTADGEKGLVTLILQPDGARLCRLSSRFWVVVPRFGGITSGATGLETLVRDSYVAFLTPEPGGPQLAPGSLVAGLERPFRDPMGGDLEPFERGDLQMTLLVPENHGLDAGAAVQLRGMEVGDVRGVELAADGSHVRVHLRIREQYRKTVTDSTEFWIARPRLSGALLGGIAVEDIGALLTPYVGYYTEGERGAPVADGYHVIAAAGRPEIDPEVPAGARRAPPPSPRLDPRDPGAIRLVEVVYEVEERDWLSGNDHQRREGTGVLYIDDAGRPVVATARSLCDGSVFMSDTLGDPDIKSETIRVVVAGVGVLRAGRSWVDPSGADLAVLVLEGAPPDLVGTPPSRFSFEAAEPVPQSAWSAGAKEPAKLAPGALPPLPRSRGAVLMIGGQLFGIVGEEKAGERPVAVPLSRLPDVLRPGS